VYITTPGASLDAASPNISNVTYPNSFSFTQLSFGSLQLRLTLHNSKQVIYDAGTVPFANGVSYTLVVYTKGSSTLVNSALLVNFAKRVSNLGTNAASSYVELPEDTYAINFDLTGTTTVVLSMPSVSVTASHTYTLYLVGSTGTLAGVLTRDD